MPWPAAGPDFQEATNVNPEIKPVPESPRQPLKPPPDYRSTAVRLRLLALFAALVLVLILMKEARKPERWSWMGFANSPAPATRHQPPRETNEAEPASGRAESGLVRPSRGELILDLASAANDYPAAAEQFWRETMAELTHDQQKRLFLLLKVAAAGQSVPSEFQEQQQKLIELLSEKREQFHERLEEQVSYLPTDSAGQQRLREELTASRQIWQETVLPAWQVVVSGDDMNMAQLTANVRLKRRIEELALQQVIDRTSLNRPDEAVAWLACWDRAQSYTDFRPVTQVELTSQPEVFRGQPVHIEGWVRAARRMNVRRNDLDMDHYYILWVRPADTNVAPYCVYASQLPENFPKVNRQLTDLNEPIQVDGVFYKIRSYTTTANQVATCALLLTRQPMLAPVAVTAEAEDWSPPWWAIITFLVVMPLIAAAIAWLAFRSTEPRHFVAGAKTQQSIASSLEAMKGNPDIQTDLERVQMLQSSLETKSQESES